MKDWNLGFIGFGLIGGSIARALKKKNQDLTVTVYSRRQNPALEKGKKEGIIDRLVYSIGTEFSSCDIIFLCAPVIENENFLPALKNLLSPGCLVTDVGSVKGNICHAAQKAGLARQFIGGHPMAGSEKTGYENSTATLFENAYYFLTPTPENRPEDVTRMQELVKATGANCVTLSPQEHDRITAAISHVPHIIAVSLVNLVRRNDNPEENMKAFAAGGFKDITRIASSSPAMWQDICLANGSSIDFFLEQMETQIREFRKMIAADNKRGIYDAFQTAGDYRNSIPNTKSSILARSYQIFINVDDRAGAIAAITSVLSENGINIKNIGIVNNREFTGGVLRLVLTTSGDAVKSKEILAQHGYEIVERH